MNAVILGTHATPATHVFDMYIKEVAREMTQKAGQKCTAIRRVLVPQALIEPVQSALESRLAKVSVGDPREEGTRMGALAGIAQRKDVAANVARLRAESEVVLGGQELDLGGALSNGAFYAPTLLRCDTPDSAEGVHSIEAFGPVATLMPYRDLDHAATLANLGLGSLALSIFSHDGLVVRALVGGTSFFHGRIMIVDRDSAADATGHGAALPHLQHGGPGRAGGGAELGGILGMMPYLQRSALQAAPATLDMLEGM